jgi:hypothetical protein
MKNCSAQRIFSLSLPNPKASPSSKATRAAFILMNLGSDDPQSSSFFRDQPGKMSSTFHAVLNILTVLCSSFLCPFVCLIAVPFSFRLLRAVSLQAPKSGFHLYPSSLHYALFPPVSFLLNLDSTRLPGHICVNPHHDLVCITPFFLGFPCIFSAEP